MQPSLDIHRRCYQNCFRIERDVMLGLGVFMVYMFPLLGNAITYPWGCGTIWRRVVQISLLLTGVWIVWFYGVLPDVGSFFMKFLSSGAHKTLGFSLIVITAVGITNSVGVKQFPVSFSLAKFPIVVIWVSIGPILWFHHAIFKSSWKRSAENTSSETKFNQGIIIAAICLFIAMVAWGFPPDMSTNNLDLRGSSTIVGVCSVIACFSILYSLKLRFAFGAAFPPAYLFLYSTARQSWLVFLLLTFVFGIFQFCTFRGRLLKKLQRSVCVMLLIGIVLPVVIIGPLSFLSHYYPYLRTQCSVSELAFQAGDIGSRLGRLLRILPQKQLGYALESIDCAIDAFKNHFMWMSSANEKTLQRIGESARVVEDRNEIWSNSLKLSLERPFFGHWPADFFLTTGGGIYRHPHNFTLEMAFYFGWPLACIGSLSFLSLFFIAIRHLT